MSLPPFEVRKATRLRQYSSDVDCLKRTYGRNPTAYEQALKRLNAAYGVPDGGDINTYDPQNEPVLPQPFHLQTNNYSADGPPVQPAPIAPLGPEFAKSPTIGNTFGNLVQNLHGNVSLAQTHASSGRSGRALYGQPQKTVPVQPPVQRPAHVKVPEGDLRARWESYVRSSSDVALEEALQCSPFHNPDYAKLSERDKQEGYALLCRRELESKLARVKPNTGIPGHTITDAEWAEELIKKGQTPLTLDEARDPNTPVQYPRRPISPGARP